MANRHGPRLGLLIPVVVGLVVTGTGVAAVGITTSDLQDESVTPKIRAGAVTVEGITPDRT